MDTRQLKINEVGGIGFARVLPVTDSYAPMSHAEPWGRETPSLSVVKYDDWLVPLSLNNASLESK